MSTVYVKCLYANMPQELKSFLNEVQPEGESLEKQWEARKSEVESSSKLQEIVKKLSRDEKFNQAWEKLKECFGDEPRLVYGDSRGTQFPASTTIIKDTITNETRVFQVWMSPVITVRNPAIEGLEVFELVMSVFNAVNNALTTKDGETYGKESLSKTFRFINRQKHPGGLLDLPEPARLPGFATLIRSTESICVIYKQGSTHVDEVTYKYEKK